MFRNRKFWIALALLTLVSGGGYRYYSINYLPAQTPEEPAVQTATVRQGDLVISASAIGELIPAREIELGFSIGGQLAEVLVQPGEAVQAGDVLARLGDLDELEVAQAQLELANAQVALQEAEYNRRVLQAGNRAGQDAIAATQADLVLAELQADKAQDAFNQVSGRPENNAVRANALAKLEAAKAARDRILRQLNWYYGAPSQVEQAVLDAEVAVAEARLAAAQQILDGTALVVPFDGTVLAVTAQVGDQVGTEALITLVDMSQPLLEIYLDETDFDKIDLDYEVEVVFDALPDTVFTGRVVQVNPALSVVDGVTTVSGLVRLDANSSDGALRLPIGSNASVEVIASKAQGVILVPVEALREFGSGEYAVFVMQDGEPVLRVVQVGLIDYSFAEIISGLEAGEIVTTGIVETE